MILIYDVSGLPDLDNLLRDVNAGETITFSDLAGTYATLQRTIDEDFSELGDATVYLSDSALTTPPQNLTVDISRGGGDFPAFDNVFFPSVFITEITPSVEQDINADTTLRWIGNHREPFGRMFMTIDFDNGLNIICNALDDGSFSFPEDTRALISESSATFVSIDRTAIRITSNGNATLLSVHSVHF